MELDKDEADGGYNVDGKDRGASEDTGSGRDTDINSNGGDDVRVDVDEGEKDDDIDMLDRCSRGNHPGDCTVFDWLKGEHCIDCKSRSGEVLLCSENDCPLAFHEVCMTWKPELDDMGKFYCPYCLYKQEISRFKELRKKFMLAEEGLYNFICLTREGGSKEKKMKGSPDSAMAGEVNTGDCENKQNDDGKEKCDEGSTFRADRFDNAVKGERMVADIQHSSGSKEDAIDEDQRQIGSSSSSNVGIVEGTLRVPMKETSDIVGLMEENPGQRDKEEPELQNPVGTGMASKVHAVESFEFVSPDLVTENLVAGEKLDKQTDKRSRAKNMNMNREGNIAAAKISVECRKSAKSPMIPNVMDAGKRKRLNWTAEEEEMLRELVPSFASKINKNIPWRKILEQGRPVFHSTRMPADLKDKWKKIMPKESQKGNGGN
ncbi:hypothetical protein V6N13_021536 [Hibiscus sabdariffa]|uniref:Myb-like domain-containing protein n=1 Tax=Hibiscus sabdariffa TaxID=183260 RepID=A0ABR1ZVN8_9ROSI